MKRLLSLILTALLCLGTFVTPAMAEREGGGDTNPTVTFYAEEGEFNQEELITTDSGKTYVAEFEPGSTLIDVEPHIYISTGEGRRFSHWSRGSAGGAEVAFDTELNDGDEFYANYINDYIITFNLNGGVDSEGSSDDYPVSFAEGDPISYYIEGLKKGNQLFSYWSLDPEGEDPIDDPENYFVTEPMTVYAQYEDSIRLTFDPNGGFFEYLEMTDFTETADGKVYVDVLSGKPYSNFPSVDHTAKIYAQWTLDQAGTQPLPSTYSDEDYIPTEDTTLYAQYLDAYTVTFDARNGHFENGQNTATQKVIKDDNVWYFESPVSNDPTQVFQYWSRDPEGEKRVSLNQFEITRDLTLYAQYNTPVTLTLKTDIGGWFSGYDDKDDPIYDSKELNVTIAKGSRLYDVLGETDYLSYDDDAYDLFGWSETPNGEVINEHNFTINENTILYAVFGKKITLKFHAEGGFFEDEDDPNIAERSATTNEPLDYFTPTPSHETKALLGWATKSGGELIDDPYEYILSENDTDFYAVWADGAEITFDANEGSFIDDIPNPYTVKCPYNQPIGKNAPFVYRDGYGFTGWKENRSGEGADKTDELFAPGTEGLTLYASFEKAYTVTLNAGRGSFPSGDESVVEIRPGAILSDVFAYVDPPTCRGQKPSQWKDKDGNVIDPETYVVNGDVTIYAVYDLEKKANAITASNITKAANPNAAQTFPLNAKATGGKLTYSSNNANIKVDANGNVTIAKNYAGSATITITAEDDTYAKVTKNVTVTATALDNAITAADVTKKSASKAQSFALGAKQLGSGAMTYSSNNAKVTVNGSGTVTIAAKFVGEAKITINAPANGAYKAASKTITLTVKPTGTSLKKVKNSKSRKASVTWKRNKNVTGYQIQYSTSKNFKKNKKTVTIKKNKTVKKTLSKLKKKKTYYVRIRTYKTVNGKKYYSSWSKAKKVKIKK